MNGALFVVVVVAVLAFLEMLYAFARYLGERRGLLLKRRLRLGDAAPVAGGAQILRMRRVAKITLLHDLLSGLRPVEVLEALIEQTDFDLTVAQLLGYMLLLGVGGAALGFWMRNLPLAVLLAAGLCYLPILVVLTARARRSQRISDQLPEALDMIARALKAGHALPSSFKLVAQECPLPIAAEFAKAHEQQNLGLALEAAVVRMTERVPQNLDLKLFAVSVVIQKDTGGNMVEVLENLAQTLRDRFKFYSKLRALTAEGRLSGIILCSLPFGVAILLSLGNPVYLKELSHGLGLMFLAIGLGLWGMGALWMRTLMKVEY